MVTSGAEWLLIGQPEGPGAVGGMSSWDGGQDGVGGGNQEEERGKGAGKGSQRVSVAMHAAPPTSSPSNSSLPTTLVSIQFLSLQFLWTFSHMLHLFARTVLTNWGTETTEMYCLTVLEAESPGTRCWQWHMPSEGTRVLDLSPSFWEFLGL